MDLSRICCETGTAFFCAYRKAVKGVGLNESNDLNFGNVHQFRKISNNFVVENQKTRDMRHKTELLQILGYSLALIIHMVLIMQLAVLLNKSLNIL